MTLTFTVVDINAIPSICRYLAENDILCSVKGESMTITMPTRVPQDQAPLWGLLLGRIIGTEEVKPQIDRMRSMLL